MPESKKRKKNYYITAQNKKFRTSEELRPGMQGYVITCRDDRERKGTVMEAYRILNEYGDKKYGPEEINKDDNDEDNEDVNIEDALKKEVSDIKSSNAKGAARRFQNVRTKSKNVMFIKTSVEDPTSLLDDIFQDLISSQMRKTKYCLRFLPVICTCYAKADNIIKFAKQYVEPVFVEQKQHEIIRFCIVWKTRCNNAVKRDDVLPPLIDYIFSKVEHITDYNNPDVVVNIDVIGNICCIGLLRNFQKFKKYNIDLIVPAVTEKEETKELENSDDAKYDSEPCQSSKDEIDVANDELVTVQNEEECSNDILTEDTPAETNDNDSPIKKDDKDNSVDSKDDNNDAVQ